jgi:Putative antitoxin
LDAYEKLRAVKRSGESFSEVVRRALFPDAPQSGASLRTYYRSGGGGVSERYLDTVEESTQHDFKAGQSLDSGNTQ